MKILVTGGAGFIGSHLCDTLLKKDHTVIAVDNFSPHYHENIKRNNLRGALENKNFRFHQVDITDINSIGEIISRENPDSVIHLAAEVGSRKSLNNPYPYYHVNITGTQSVIDACLRSQVRHLVMASSGSVYQGPSVTPFHEEHTPAKPYTPYSMTKRINEMMGQTCCSVNNIHITALRIFTTFGPRQRPDMAIHKFFHLMDQNKPIPVLKTANGKRDYIYISDCIRGIIKSLEDPSGYRIINIGSGKATHFSNFIQTMEEIIGKKLSTNEVDQPLGDWEGGAADLTRARDMLTFEPRYSFKEGLESFYQWFQNNNNQEKHV